MYTSHHSTTVHQSMSQAITLRLNGLTLVT